MTKPFDIPKQLVWQAYELVKANAGAAGVDKQTLDDFEKGGEIDQPKWKCGFTCLALITIHRSQAIR